MTSPLAQLAAPSRRTDRRRGGLAALVLAGLLAAAAIVAVDGGGGPEPVPALAIEGDGEPDENGTAPDAEDRTAAEQLDPLASQAPLGVAEGLSLFVPGMDPVVVSYHEASFPEARAIAPAGSLTVNENATRFNDPGATDGEPYRIQVSRGRRQGPTTAVDVALEEGSPVLSPIAGRVVEVRRYQLYSTHDDVRLELAPDGHDDLRVVLIHIEGVRVQAGDRVAVGDVLADNARLFPFEAVVDRAFAPARHGHVHLEVKLASSRR